MIILLDMDDTIEELLRSWVLCLNSLHGLNVQYEDVTEWDMCKAYPSLTKEQIEAPLMTRSFWHGVHPKHGAQYYTKKLIDEGHTIIIVTATRPENIAIKIDEIMRRLFPFIPVENVVTSYKKALIRGDVMVDDYPPNLFGGRWKKRILMDAPYNRSFDNEAYGIVRAKTWHDVYEIITKEDEEPYESLLGNPVLWVTYMLCVGVSFVMLLLHVYSADISSHAAFWPVFYAITVAGILSAILNLLKLEDKCGKKKN